MRLVKLFSVKPGIYLYLMFFWVLTGIPGEVSLVKKFDDYDVLYANKYILHCVLCILVALILNIIEINYCLWTKRSNWQKYFILNGCYTITAWVACILTVVFHRLGYINYVGDMFGTIVILYWPTIILYWVVGIPITILLNCKSKFKGLGSFSCK